MEAKPICVIYFPDLFLPNINRGWIYEYMAFLNGDGREDGKMKWHTKADYYKDYYWFCFYDAEIQTPRFEVFNVKELTEVNFEELKRMVEEAIQKNKTPNQ